MLIRDTRQENKAEHKKAHDAWLLKMGINPATPKRQKKGTPGRLDLPNLREVIGRNPALVATSDRIPGSGTKPVKRF